MTASINPEHVVLTWCADHHATIDFRRDHVVAIRVGKVEGTGPTLADAWLAAVAATAPARTR